MDATELLNKLSWELFVVCALAFGLGAIGGVLHPTDAPADPPTPPPPSKLTRLLVGGVAAVAVLYLTRPSSGVALVGGSIAAGYAGHAILAGLESRALAAIAQADAQQKGQDVREALAAHRTLTEVSRGTPTAKQEENLALAQLKLDDLAQKYSVKGGKQA